MLHLKPGVKVNGIQPELVMAIMVVNGVYQRKGYKHTVTSLSDGKHSARSLHYAGLAFDNRTWADDFGNQLDHALKEDLADEIRAALGDEFDVVVEPTHIHIEFHPD